MKRKYGGSAGKRRIRRRLFPRKKRTWRRKYLRGRSGFAKAVKRVILKTAEKKFTVRDLKDAFRYNSAGGNMIAAPVDIFGQIAAYHNNMFVVHIQNNVTPDGTKHVMPAQGTTDQSRNGDEIYGTGIRLRMQLENDGGKHNNTWKFWLVEWNSAQGTSPGIPGEFFMPGGIGNCILDQISTDRWKAKLIGVFRTGSRDVATDAKTNIFINKWIPLKRHIYFQSDSTIAISRGMKEYYTIVGVCYDASNTVYDTSVGNYRINATFYYKDP